MVKQSLKLLSSLQGAQEEGVIWYSKTDLKSTLCLLGLKLTCWWLMVMVARHPATSETYYFIDKCLPFGHSISCALFQKFSDAYPVFFCGFFFFLEKDFFQMARKNDFSRKKKKKKCLEKRFHFFLQID